MNSAIGHSPGLTAGGVAASSRGRLDSVDAFRALAAFAVVCIHTFPRGNPRLNLGSFCNLGDILDQLCRFAVPFFFTAAGYFFARGLGRTGPLRLLGRYGARLGLLYVVWSIIYALAPAPASIARDGLLHAVSAALHAHFGRARVAPFTTLLEGTAPHLWFFPALLISLAIAALVAAIKAERLLLPVGILLYVAGLMGGSYEHTPLGSTLFGQFNTRDGPFYGTLFVAAGFVLARRPVLSARLGWALAVGGVCLHMAEALLLRFWVGRPVNENDYVLGSAAWGIGLMIIALSAGPTWRPVRLAWIGRMSLGIYVMHWLFRPVALKLVSMVHREIVWLVAFPVLLFAMTAAAVWLLQKAPVARRLVS